MSIKFCFQILFVENGCTKQQEKWLNRISIYEITMTVDSQIKGENPRIPQGKGYNECAS